MKLTPNSGSHPVSTPAAPLAASGIGGPIALNRNRLGELLKRRAVFGNESIGYHGTSLEALGIALRTGALPSVKTGSLGKADGWIFFSPRPEHPTIKSMNIPKGCEVQANAAKAFDDARQYARLISQRAALVRLLRIPLNNKECWGTANELIMNGISPRDFTKPYPDYNCDMAKLLVDELGHGERDICAALKLARRCEGGVVLSLGSRILEEFNVEPARKDSGLKIHAPQGIPLEMFVGAWVDQESPRESRFAQSMTGTQPQASRNG